MTTSTTWPKVLEEHAYLVQMLSEVSHDSGALEHTGALLDIFRDDLRSCTTQVAEMERENQGRSLKPSEPKSTPSMPRFCSRFYGNKGSDGIQHIPSQNERQEQLLAGWTLKRTLATEVKNLEIRARVLQRRSRHYNELQTRLSSLYTSIFDAKRPLNRDIDEADANERSAQRALHEVQRVLDQHTIVAALLTQGHFALINAAHHLTTAESSGSSGQVDAAKKCAMQTCIVLDQAKRIHPSFFDLDKDAEVLKEGWFSEVFNQTLPPSLPTTLVHALKLHHNVLVSIISRAHKRTAEQKAVASHAALKCMEARARKDGLRRRALVAFANAEAEDEIHLWSQGDLADGVLETDLPGKSRDITAGLDGVIPVVVSQQPLLPTRPGSSDIQQRAVQPRPHVLPLAQPKPRLHPSNNLLHGLILDSDDLPPTTSPNNIDDGWAQPRSASTSMDSHQSSSVDSIPRQPLLTPQFDRQGPVTIVPGPRLQSQSQLSRPVNHESRSSPLPPQPYNVPLSQPQPPPSQFGIAAQPLASHIPNTVSDTHPRYLSPDLNVGESVSLQPSSRPGPAYQHQRQWSKGSGMSSLQDGIPTPTRDSEELLMKKSQHANPAWAKKTELQPAGVPSSLVPGPSHITHPVAKVGPHSHLPPQRLPIHGILKHPPVGRASPVPLPADDPDAWGVKAVSISSSRPPPKLKAVFNLLRASEGKTLSSGQIQARSHAQSEQPPPPAKNPRASFQKLRFVEGVETIPRPAIDSEPYEDEDEEEEEEDLPPSPRRGSIVWTQMGEKSFEDGWDEGRGVSPAQLPYYSRPDLVDEKRQAGAFPSSASSPGFGSRIDTQYVPRPTGRTTEKVVSNDYGYHPSHHDPGSHARPMSEPEFSINKVALPSSPMPRPRGWSSDRVPMPPPKI